MGAALEKDRVSTSCACSDRLAKAVSQWGLPNGYILGEEASGAFIGGLRYGDGTLYTKNAGDVRVFWQGPSLGFDAVTEIELLEPSIADVLTAIEAAPDLSATKKTHWSCSLRQVSLGIGRPPESIPGRWSGVNMPVQKLHYARVGCNPKTLANHKANARAALTWFAGVNNLPKRGTVLSPSWTSLNAKIPEKFRRNRLSGLIRYASAKSIEPKEVNEEVLDDYMRYRAETTALAANSAARRLIARAWNACGDAVAEWPRHRLVEPPLKALTEIPWGAFPEGLRADIERYLAGFTKIRRRTNGKRIKLSTIQTRRRELQAFARMAVRQGAPIESLDSPAALVQPDLADKVLDAYWDQNGEEPSTSTIDMGWKILSVARETGCLSDEDMKKLDEKRAALEEHRREGLTDKNRLVVWQVLTEGVWDEVVRLPRKMMVKARLLRHHAPVKAAVTAQLATAIAIFVFAPIRLDVKNRVQLEFKLIPELSALIDEYINDYRPTLLRGSNDLWLFPGQKRDIKN